MLDTRSDRRNVLIITFVALVIRLGLAIWFFGIRDLPANFFGGGDGAVYMGMAHYVYATATLSSPLFLPRPPLFPALAGVLYHVTGEVQFDIVFVNMIVNVISCLVIYQLARNLEMTVDVTEMGAKSLCPGQFTLLPITNFVPVSVRSKLAPPAMAESGVNALNIGRGFTTVKPTVLDTPPGAGFVTLIGNVPVVVR